MKTNYQIELANNGMIIRRVDVGDVEVFEYMDDNRYSNIGKWLGTDILDDMLESPDVEEEIRHLLQKTGESETNNFEISVEIKPVIK